MILELSSMLNVFFENKYNESKNKPTQIPLDRHTVLPYPTLDIEMKNEKIIHEEGRRTKTKTTNNYFEKKRCQQQHIQVQGIIHFYLPIA